MVLKEFAFKIPDKGKVEVSFYLHFDGADISVGEIKVHTDFESTLPHRAWLKQDNGTWKLYDDHPRMENGEVVVRPEFLNDDISNEIVKTILSLKTVETV